MKALKVESRTERLMRLREAWNEYREYHKRITTEKAIKLEVRSQITFRQERQKSARKNPQKFLHQFWLEWTPTFSTEERLSRLREAAQVWIEKVNKKSKLLKLSETECAVCGAPATARHHILQLQNGGPNIPENICGLCDGCHEEIHPWMKQAV